jgi:hypothetical protein
VALPRYPKPAARCSVPFVEEAGMQEDTTDSICILMLVQLAYATRLCTTSCLCLTSSARRTSHFAVVQAVSSAKTSAFPIELHTLVAALCLRLAVDVVAIKAGTAGCLLGPCSIGLGCGCLSLCCSVFVSLPRSPRFAKRATPLLREARLALSSNMRVVAQHTASSKSRAPYAA